MTGSIAQLVNGVLLMASSVLSSLLLSPHLPPQLPLLSPKTDPNATARSFFGARICFGAYMTYKLWRLLDDPRISPAMRWGFRTANLALNGKPASSPLHAPRSTQQLEEPLTRAVI